jgi:Lon protease-like protein
MEIPATALEELAIFPLPGMVLFPNALLPLHVFEPRYRVMMADVLAGSRLLAVARIRPGHEDDHLGRPPVFDTIGVGRVVNADHLPDGRYNLLLRGLARVRVEREHRPLRAYRQVTGRILRDDLTTRPELIEGSHRELLALCDRLAEVVPPDGAEALRRLARTITSPGGCADVVAAALVRDADVRQTLLELLDPADRLEELARYVALLVAQLGRSPRVVN